MKKKSAKQRFTAAPKAGVGKKLSAGPKLKGFLGVTRKRSEPENPILQPQSMPLGRPAPNPGNKGSKAAASKARLARLEGRRI